MPIDVTLTDGTGQIWQFKSGRGMDTDAGTIVGFGLEDGTSDTVDNGFVILVNGTGVNPQSASVDGGGREINTAPVLIDGVAVSRSVRVDDIGGFARFLDSFTNTTDQAVTITVETLVNSGADTALQFTATTSGETLLDAMDNGYVTDDANTNGADTALTVHFGDGTLPATATSVTSGGGFNDLITVTHTLTLQPGETQSLLQFGAQNFSASEGLSDLTVFNNPNVFAFNPELLTGLSDAERASVVNYANVAPPPSATLVDSDGNRWNINQFGHLSSLDTNALVLFDISVFPTNFDTLVSFSQDAANDEVTMVRTGLEAVPDSTVTYTYRALPDQGLIRLLVTWQGGTGGIGNTTLDPRVITGANPALVPVQFFEDAFGEVSGVVLDDSESGTGGTLPALTYVFGATGADNTSGATNNTFSTFMPGQGIGAGETRQYLFFFALNDTGLDALADLARLNTPGPEELAGLSAAQVAAMRNFVLDETDRLQVTTGNSNDNVIDGHYWGDNINGDAGDDTISAGASDDLVNGGDGLDDIDGGDGNDILAGGAKDDLVSGGNGNDTITGDDGNDLLLGEAGDDTIAGGVGNDTIRGNIGVDTLQGDAGIDTLNGGHGDDDLFGGSENDRLAGGKGADDLFGEDGNDTLNGGLDADRMLGGAGNDQYFVDNTLDRVFETTTFASNINAGGIDTVNSSITFNLDLYASVRFAEHLTLTGTAAINGTGNNLGNRIAGNSGANQLNGGLGNDTLIGGLGADRFVFNTALGNTNIDRISDFEDGVDKIRLDDAIFVGLDVANVLDPNAFVANASGQAENTSQHIIYETDTGRLFYDVDGLNGVARVQFGTMGIGLAIDNTDFQVV